MHEQEKQLVALVRKGDVVTAQELAEQLGVTERTVRSRVDRANAALGGIARIEGRRGQGYTLAVGDPSRLDAWLAQSIGRGGAEVPSTHDGRVAYLLNDLCLRTGWITLDDLAEVLFVSRRTISNDLRAVERILGRFGLELTSKPHHGIKVSGTEAARRSCLVSLNMESLLNATSDPHVSDMIRHVAQSVQDALANVDCSLSTIAYQNLVMHIAVAVVRMKTGQYAPMPPEELERIARREEFELAGRIAALVDERLDVRLPREEVAYIAMHLSGGQVVSYQSEEGEPVISDDVWNAVSEMTERVWETYRFDLRSDLELHMALARHIAPLSIRLRYGMHLKNPLLKDIKQRYSLAFAMAVDASGVLAERYGAVPSDDEVGYIALTFALALERQRARYAASKKRILIVCATGEGSARLLEWRYEQEFAGQLASIETCDAARIDSVDLSRIDYVFTTVPLPHPLPVPVRLVSFFLNESEVREISNALRAPRPKDDRHMRYFRSGLFFAHLDFESKWEVIEFLCDRMAEWADDPAFTARFKKLVLDRERAFPTSFGNLIAMPHSTEALGALPLIAVGVLDAPVVWDERGNEVQVVFMASFAREGHDDFADFMGVLADLFSRSRTARRLTADQRFETLASLLADREETPGAPRREDESTERTCHRELVIRSKTLHARPAADIARVAASLGSDVRLVYGNQSVDAKSPLDVLSLNVASGSTVRFELDGNTADKDAEVLNSYCESNLTDIG